MTLHAWCDTTATSGYCLEFLLKNQDRGVGTSLAGRRLVDALLEILDEGNASDVTCTVGEFVGSKVCPKKSTGCFTSDRLHEPVALLEVEGLEGRSGNMEGGECWRDTLARIVQRGVTTSGRFRPMDVATHSVKLGFFGTTQPALDV